MNSTFFTRQTLIERVKSTHDEKSWVEFVSYYRDYLYMICRRMSLSHHDAEEIVQKVLVKLWQKLPEINPQELNRFRSWLCTVTGNAVKDFLRKQTRQAKHELQDNEYDMSVQPDVNTLADEEWKSYLVTLAIENVTPRFSKTVMSVFHDLHSGQTREQIAKQYSIPPGTVSVYKHRVLSALCNEINRLERDLS